MEHKPQLEKQKGQRRITILLEYDVNGLDLFYNINI
jgi:hypothetical protein